MIQNIFIGGTLIEIVLGGATVRALVLLFGLVDLHVREISLAFIDLITKTTKI